MGEACKDALRLDFEHRLRTQKGSGFGNRG